MYKEEFATLGVFFFLKFIFLLHFLNTSKCIKKRFIFFYLSEYDFFECFSMFEGSCVHAPLG